MSELAADDVKFAYRLLLGREPESEAVVTEHLNINKTLEDLRATFINSPEFKNSIIECWDAETRQDIYSYFWNVPEKVEVDVAPDILVALLGRVADQWRDLGDVNPYWSVLTHDKFRADNINDESLSEFYSTGAVAADVIDLFERRTGVIVPAGTCFELGCGVGRVTAHLAKRFEKVIAADISPGNLAICQEYLDKMGISNVQTMLLNSPNQLLDLPQLDFFYSVIVLQHNPPPVQKFFLKTILDRIQSGGACIFQAQGELAEYSFSSAEFLQGEKLEIDMHCLPKHFVLELLNERGFNLRELALDDWTGHFGSYTYFATKD